MALLYLLWLVSYKDDAQLSLFALKVGTAQLLLISFCRKRLNFLNVSLIFPGKLNSVFQNFHFLLLAFRFVSFQIQFNSSSDQLNLLEVQITHALIEFVQSCSWRLTDSEEKIEEKLKPYLRNYYTVVHDY
ncbi:hypothetical protein P8452_34703 [Trifolium repens]|nr:hypothetical protein P8452_34703 [Trifolium repens]